MMRRYLQWFAAVLGLLLLGTIAIYLPQLDSQDDVIFYPTYGVQDAATRAWEIQMRAKVQEPRSIAKHIEEWLGEMPSRGAEEDNRFRTRIADFVADDKSREKVTLQFDDDSDRKEYRIANKNGDFPETNGDGVVDGRILLPDNDARRLLTAQRATNGWLTYRATSRGHAGVGRVQLIGPTGVSIISDIDDTIKITEVPAGKPTVVINTFYREFVPVPEMIAKYRGYGDAAFHYVSGGPWQLYRPVSSFLIDARLFPEGSFHMKPLSGSIRSPISSFGSLERFVDTDGTFDHKVAQITAIMERFPGRTFILIGDSGERDPDVYRTVKGSDAVGARVQEIIIRDVVNAREKDPNRLQGMTILAAPTIVDAGLQLSRE